MSMRSKAETATFNRWSSNSSSEVSVLPTHGIPCHPPMPASSGDSASLDECGVGV
jgi:hypothetical protein